MSGNRCDNGRGVCNLDRRLAACCCSCQWIELGAVTVVVVVVIAVMRINDDNDDVAAAPVFFVEL